MEQYIEHQLSRLTKDTPKDKVVYHINGIYAVLESKGYNHKEIRLAVDKILWKKINENLVRVKKILED